MRGKMKLLGAMPDSRVKPTMYDAAVGTDAAPFDSVPGMGFNSDPAAAVIVPPVGRITGSGPVLLVDPAQNNTFRALNRAWQQGATVQDVGGGHAVARAPESPPGGLAKNPPPPGGGGAPPLLPPPPGG